MIGGLVRKPIMQFLQRFLVFLCPVDLCGGCQMTIFAARGPCAISCVGEIVQWLSNSYIIGYNGDNNLEVRL